MTNREKLREPHVRFTATFLLDDARIQRLSDGATRLYVMLEALAIRLRREVLPSEYDADELAGRLRRPAQWALDSLEELSGGSRPLVRRLEDGRLWVVGVQRKHGRQFRWKDVPPDAAAARETPSPDATHTRHTPDTHATHTRHTPDTNVSDTCHDTDTMRGEVESDTDSPPPSPPATPTDDATTPPRATAPSEDTTTAGNVPSGHDTATSGPAAQIVDGWGVNGFRAAASLRRHMAAWDLSDPVTLLAHVREVEQARGLASRHAALYARLRPNGKRLTPSDAAYQWARDALAGGAAQPRGGPPVGVAEVALAGDGAR